MGGVPSVTMPAVPEKMALSKVPLFQVEGVPPVPVALVSQYNVDCA